MKAVYQLVGLALLLLVSSSIVLGDSNTCGTTLAPCKTNPTNAYMACVSQDFISQVSAYLPESVPVPESLINPSDWNANVFYNFSTLASQSGKKVTDFQAYINVTILWEGAGYRNQFGYFLFNYDSHGNPQIRTDKHGNKQQFKLFTDVSFPNAGDPGACLQSGVSVDIGPFVDGDNVGFACWPDGYNTNSHATLYTANKLNPNNAVHVFMFSIDDKYIIGMEDIDPLSSSDRDYNDIVFQFQTTLDATINVPVLDSCPDPTCGGTGHGVCNSTTKTCTCSSSASLTYYGDDCQYSYTCTCQQGVCIGNGECSCNTDKFGADCSSCAAGRYNYPDCKTCDNYCDTDKGYTCDPSGNCIAPVPPPNPTPYCLTAPFGVASDYLAFVRADFNGENSDIQGRLAAGGDVDLFQYSLAEALNPTDDDTLGCQDITPSWAAVAVGDFTFSSGNARIGSLAVGGNNEIDPSVSSGLAPDCSVVPTDQAVDVESNFDFLFGLSDALSNLDDNGNVYSTKDSKTTLVFAAPNNQPDDYNFVFELDASDLSAADSVILNNFQGMQVKAIVINVDVTKYEFKDTSFSDILAGSSQYLASKIIWNFYNAHTITIDSIAIPGYLLAPGANVKGTNGVLNGALFANSFEGDLQFNYPVGSEGLCIMSNFHIDIGDAPCPPCDDGATPGKGCRCECENACPHGKFADPFGSCACICPIDNDCVLGQDPDTCLCLGTTPASSDGSCSGSYDGIAWPSWLTDFQIVTAGDLTLKATRVGGRVAGGGTTTLKRIAVGNDLPQSKNYDCTSTNGQEVAGVVLANGPLNFKSGSVTGNILFGDYTQIAEYLSFPQVVKSGVVGCNLPQSAVADLASNWNFANAFTALQAYSDAIAQASVTGQSYFAFDVLTFWGYNRTVEVFRVDNDDLNSARRIDVSNVRADATIIIDITGHSVSIKDVGIASLLPWGGALIWNAANANTFSFKNVALPGLILAPGADISNPVGRLVGGAFVNSFSASGNVALEWPVPNWAGCLPAADLITASCADCPAGSIRSSASTCDCDAVVTITQNSVSIFEGNNGALVTFGISVIGRAPSGVTINFPNDGTCTLQLNKGTPNVFSLNKISNPSGTTGFTYQTPNYAGFSAAAYSFVTVFQGSTINSCLTVPTPTILSVEWDPIN